MRGARFLVGAGVAGLALLAAGCGGSGSARVASVSATSGATTTTQAGLVGYASCMRSHGVPTFPDPDSTGGIPKPQVVAAAEAYPSKFNAATDACKNLLPTGGLAPPQTAQQLATQLADWLSFARCMRGHGVTSFPDPTAQGELTIAMVQAHGIDPHSPAVVRAMHTCIPASHGELTPAKISEALKNHSG